MRDAFGHLKVIGHVVAATALLERAGIDPDIDRDDGLIPLDGKRALTAFIAAAKGARVWAREVKLRSPG